MERPPPTAPSIRLLRKAPPIKPRTLALEVKHMCELCVILLRSWRCAAPTECLSVGKSLAVNTTGGPGGGGCQAPNALPGHRRIRQRPRKVLQRVKEGIESHPGGRTTAPLTWRVVVAAEKVTRSNWVCAPPLATCVRGSLPFICS